MSRMKPTDTPIAVGNLITDSDWFKKLDAEMRELLAKREKDPVWQARWEREDFLKRKEQREKLLTSMHSYLRGNYGPEVQKVAERARRREFPLEDMMRRVRKLSMDGQAMRVDAYRPVSPIKLSDEEFRKYEQGEPFDPAEEWER